MRNFKLYMFFALMLVAFTGCKIDDLKEDVDGLKDRVTLIEEQVKILNDNVEVIAYILNPEHKTIKSVVEDGGVFTITLSNNEVLILNVGSEGVVNEPSVSVSDDGYWVINGVATDKKAVGADGDNRVPQFDIRNEKWQVSYDGGSTWELVEGNYDLGEAGDQFFKAAVIEGDNFVITAKDGVTEYTLPIVKGLTCAINRTGEVEGYFLFEYGTKKDFEVTMEGDGELLAPIYPEGWRAELNKAEAGKYTLTVYAPVQKTVLSRITANNQEEIAVRANKGMFWAVDKIKVKLPKSYDNDLAKYNDGLPINIAGVSISKDVYGEATEVSSSMNITEGGVYFVTANDVTLTFNSADAITTPLVLVSLDKKTTFKMAKKMNINSDFICKNITFQRSGDFITLSSSENPINIVFDTCIFDDNNANKTWIAGEKGQTINVKNYNVYASDFKLTFAGGLAGSFLKDVECESILFNNNIVYYYLQGNADGVIGSDTPELSHLNNFKILNAQNNTVGTVSVSDNTFVDVESNYKSGANGMIWAKEVASMVFNNNLCYYSYPFIKFAGASKDQNETAFYRATVQEANGANNFVYSGNPDMKFKPAFGGSQPENFVIEQVNETFFDVMSKSDGIFVPKALYKDYGAKR